MRRFITALAFCSLLLVLLSVFLFPPVEAKENILLTLLNLPAPPPPNPLVKNSTRNRDKKFYNKSKPPADDASIEDLLDYWRHQSSDSRELRYSPEMSDKVRERLMREIGKNPKLLTEFLSALRNDPKASEFVKEIYDRESAGGVFGKDERKTIKEWLTFNSPYFSNDLARRASGVSDSGEYVTNHQELLALTVVDFDKAQPIIDRLNADASLKTSRALAKWALYRHALNTNSTTDIERYRDELKAIVEDKSAIPGMRDMAMDALAGEKEWPGRDDWYYSLLADETLAELKVNGSVHTGLTTLIIVSPDEKYIGKMIELAGSDNVWIRTAAVRNLVTRLDDGGVEVVKALLPWLEDPKWAGDADSSRQTLVQKLSEYAIPESVPGLIKLLDEKEKRFVNPANAANMMSNSVSNSNRMTVIANRPAGNYMVGEHGIEVAFTPYRYSAVEALKKQKDGRAVPALRRILPEGESYERGTVVGAILASGGFSTAEQMQALETAAKGVRAEMDAMATNVMIANSLSSDGYGEPYSNINRLPQRRPATTDEINQLLAQQLLQAPEITDELARAIVNRIELLDAKDAGLSAAYRRMILKWQNTVINILLLSDVKRGIADSETIVRLLSQRKALREKQSADVSDLRMGKPAAIGIGACLLEDVSDYVTILENSVAETKTALLACARMIRAPLPVAEVAKNLKSPGDILTIAAERYLESEDSPEARGIILARYPNEAKILGATSAFFVEGSEGNSSEQLWALYQSLGDDSLYNGWSGSGNDAELKAVEKRLQTEVKKDAGLVGVYSYDKNYIRIYNDRVIFSWEEDDSRYRERPLSKFEFDEIKSYLAMNRVDELAPFLMCGGEYCQAKELLMLGRAGGRRVYMNGETSEFFSGLDKYFADLKQTRATLKYSMSREIPGLEIVLASDDLYAETVWKDGNDLRVAASDVAARKKLTDAIEDLDIEGGESPEEPEIAKYRSAREILLDKWKYEGFGWYKVADGEIAGPAAQPPHVEYLPVRDQLGVPPAQEQWKARTADFELRTSTDGLFKIVRGKMTRLHEGMYNDALVTPNGRWAVVSKINERSGYGVVRVNLLTNKEYHVELEGWGNRYATAYIPTLNKVLIARNDRYNYGDERYGQSPNEADPEAMLLLDPVTGVTQPIAGEFRPLSQQTFRPLQKTSKPNEFWAAMADPEKNETLVGVYDINTFGFKPVLRIPKIKFNSMSMWVDDPGRKVYFVYRGHLLALPFAKVG